MVSKRNSVFLQVLFLTITVFVIGLFLGVVIEEGRMKKINDYYIDSEVSMMDILALNSLVDEGSVDCEGLKNANFDLLDRVYRDAVLLEDYEIGGRMTNNLENFHKKYDVLRTYLWIDAIKINDKCDNFNTVVYLYNNSDKDLAIKAKQNVWSKILYDLKSAQRDNVLLISIDVGSDLVSLNSMLREYEIEKYPVVIVNEREVISSLSSKEDISEFFN
jgi:hypothetical protein